MAKAKPTRSKSRKINKIHRNKPNPKETAAIVPVAAPPPATIVTASGKTRKLSSEETALLKRTVAKGTSDDEFAMFLWFCRNHQVDPVAQEVYCIMRWDKRRDIVGQDADNKPIYKGGMKMTIQMGIGGLRGLAARKHKDYGSTDEPVWNFGTRKTPANRPIPDSCTVGVWKRGADRPTKATIFWDEFAPVDLSSPQANFWNYSPANQLAKCAEAQALRKAYPDLSNIYVPEEFARADEDQTPGGRQIVDKNGFSPSGTPVTWEAQQGSHEAAQAVAQRKIEEHKAKALPEAKAAPSEPQPQPEPFKGRIEVDWTEERSPIVRGDIGDLTETLQKHFHMTWAGDWWHCEPRDIEGIRELCRTIHFELVEITPKPSPPVAMPKGDAGASRSGQRRAPATSSAPASAGLTWMTGIIKNAYPGGEGKSPKVNVVFRIEAEKKEYIFGCFQQRLFEALLAQKSKGKEATLVIQTRESNGKTYKNIIGAKKIGTQEYDDDGVTPAIQQKDREAGGKTLFV